MKGKQMEYLVNKTKKYTGAAVSALLFMITIFSYGCAEQGHAGGFQMPPMPAEVAEVMSRTVSDEFNAIGTIEANEAVTIVSEIDAAVIDLPFEEGSYVRKGALIAQLDDSQLAAELARSKALYQQSKTSFTRIKNIVEQKAGTPQDLDDAAAQLKVAEANLALAQARFTKTRITAPFDGMIGARRVSVGSFLRAGQTIAEFANINEIRINFSAPERFLSTLRKGAEVNVSTTAYSNDTVKGRIIVIEPVIDPETRNVRVVARVPNTGKKLLPGMSANISAVLSQREGALTIQNQAVFAQGNQSFVFTVGSDSTVALTPVQLGLQLNDVVEVLSGLQSGQKVVLAGHQKLFDKAKVIPISMTAAMNK